MGWGGDGGGAVFCTPRLSVTHAGSSGSATVSASCQDDGWPGGGRSARVAQLPMTASDGRAGEEGAGGGAGRLRDAGQISGAVSFGLQRGKKLSG